ncbi:Piso0_001107 [Millerozyma farinosa CBS 7064]|uniref:Piso0_001107 protein n=1 Tax=Pichia sorbitophila (strain ATCC MYA-4447 / BCRC 22081 / CBS 7064 / NBRC 10061 / NRRL Y-12695) TaxID=559304 RepID=G8YSE7_PICSO|nr:Piso0_001107 [Millerozyma farinosa CBS 7064]CCE79070.1 Piso0_001107 [Millerozyma farinosa CBS 7064]
MELEITEQDIYRLSSSWNTIHTNSRYHNDSFVSRLYANLLAANPKLLPVFSGENGLQEHSALFGELLSLTMIYLNDMPTLKICIAAYARENPLFTEQCCEIVEPMGSALVLTLRQWLGKGVFDNELQELWIKVYVMLANTLLQSAPESNESSDDCSSEQSSLEEPIPALNPRRREQSATPATSEDEDVPPRAEEKPLPIVEKPLPVVERAEQTDIPPRRAPPKEIESKVSSNTNPKMKTSSSMPMLQINLSSNEKYKGFRRSVSKDTLTADPIALEIPKTMSLSNVTESSRDIDALNKEIAYLSSPRESLRKSEPFDPRPLRRKSTNPELVAQEKGNYNTPDVPVRSAKRLSMYNDEDDIKSFRDRFASPVSSLDSLNEVDNNSDRMAAEESSTYEQDMGGDFCQKENLQDKRMSTPTRGVDAAGVDHRRLSAKGNRVVTDDLDEGWGVEKEKQFGFDPRRSHRRSRSFWSSSSEHQDAQDDAEPQDEPEARAVASPDMPAKTPVFCPESFGIKGLAPIAENEFDETASSKYESDDEQENCSSQCASTSNGDSDEVSSGVSSLSLHNSDYRSSINSGEHNSAATSPEMAYFNPGHKPRQVSTASDVSYMKPLDSRTTSHPSMLSASSLQARNRASIGFMRSSFVLKQEMQKLGLDDASEATRSKTAVASAAATPASTAATSKVNLACESSTSLGSAPSSRDGCYDLLNSFVPVTRLAGAPQHAAAPASAVRKNALASHSTASLRSGVSINSGSSTSSKRKSLRSALSRIFSRRGSSSASDQTSVFSSDTVGSSTSGFSFFSRKQPVTTRAVPSHKHSSSRQSFASTNYKVFV